MTTIESDKRYIIKRDGKYLLRIDSKIHTKGIDYAFTSKEKFALVTRPFAAGGHIGNFSVERILKEFPGAEIIETDRIR